MSLSKSKKLARKSSVMQQEVLVELQSLVKTIERAETLLVELQQEAAAVQARHKEVRSTREDVAYLEDLLKCAKMKLAWEKQMEAVAKRVPVVMGKVQSAMNDERNPPTDEMRVAVVQLLQRVGGAMARLDASKKGEPEEPSAGGEPADGQA